LISSVAGPAHGAVSFLRRDGFALSHFQGRMRLNLFQSKDAAALIRILRVGGRRGFVGVTSHEKVRPCGEWDARCFPGP
jgi:hypothetical protein